MTSGHLLEDIIQLRSFLDLLYPNLIANFLA